MLILLINLKRRPDRLAFMHNQMQALGLSFERIEAIDGKLEDVGPDTPLITATERACALSHRKAWQRFSESGESHCLILEDDVLISPLAKHIIENWRGLPNGAEIVRLETALLRTLLGPGRRCGIRGHKAHRLRSRQYGSAAYVVTRAFAERALRDIPEFVEPVDDILFQPRSPSYFPNVTYQIRPGVCLQAEAYETGQGTALARSDLETCRAKRMPPPDLSIGPRPGPEIKAKRSIPEKCVREVIRWGRRSRKLAKFFHAHFIIRRVWMDMTFTGTIHPAVEAALALSGNKHPTQQSVQKTSIPEANR